MVVGDENWNKIVASVKEAGIYVGLGLSERVGDLIYMSLVLFNPEGVEIIHRHKLRPSGGERNLWSDGLLQELTVVQTPYGRMGMLECWE